MPAAQPAVQVDVVVTLGVLAGLHEGRAAAVAAKAAAILGRKGPRPVEQFVSELLAEISARKLESEMPSTK